MRKNYFLTLLMTLFMTSVSFGQTIWEEDFSSYAENTGIEGDGAGNVSNIGDYPGSVTKWTLDATNAALFNNSDFAKTIGGVMTFRDTDGSDGVIWESESIDISGASGAVSFQLTASNNAGGFETSDFYDVFYSVDGGSFTLIQNWNGLGDTSHTILGESGGSDWNSVENIIQGGIMGSTLQIRVQAKNNASAEEFYLDNVSVFEGTASPLISILTPLNNEVFNPETTEVPVTLSIANFTLSGDNGSGLGDGTGDGFIIATLQEPGQADEVIPAFSTSPGNIDVVQGGSYTVIVELVDNAGNSLSPVVSATATFNVASYIQVTDVIGVRSVAEGDYAELTGEAILTFDAMNSRNQKYIEDNTAAILIDDNDGIITTSYNVGDGISGIKGQITSFGGVLQFVPLLDPGAATSTGNAIVPQVVSIADLNANLNSYESEWIQIDNVNFVDANGSATFAASTNYDITDGSETLVFRTQFGNADFIGTVIPLSSANIIGLAAEFNGTSQIFGTSSANIVLSVGRDEIAGYAAYPNPVKGNGLTVRTNSIDSKKVELFNVLGRKVFTQNFSGTQETFNVSNLTSGVYILKVTEGNRISTQKLIIE